MAKGLDWFLEFRDKISGPARAILGAVGELDAKLAAMTGTFGGVDGALDKTAGKLSKLGKEFDALQKLQAGKSNTGPGAYSAMFDREQAAIKAAGGVDANTVNEARAKLRADAKAANDLFAKSHKAPTLGMDFTAERGANVQSGFARLVQTLGSVSPAAANGLTSVGRSLVDVDAKLQAVGLSLPGVATGFAVAGVAAAVFATAIAFKGSSMVLSAMAFKENSLQAFVLLTKNDRLARTAYQRALSTADLLGANRRETLTTFQQLMSKGFDLNTITNITKAMADLQAINPTANVKSLTLAISQIKGKGKLQGEELMQLAEAGLSQSSVMAALAKATKKSVGDIDKAIRAGKINAEQGIDAILASVQELTGKPLGEAAIEKASSLSGLLDQLSWENIQDRLLLDVDLGPGFEAVKGALKNLNRLLNDSSDSGKRLREALGTGFGNMFASIFGKFSGPDGAVVLEKTILRVVGVIEAVLAGVTGFFSGLGGALADGLGMGAKSFSEMTAPERAKAIEKISADFQMLGTALGDVLVFGAAVVGMFVGLGEAISFAAQLIYDPINLLLGALDGKVEGFHAKGTSLGQAIANGVTFGLYGAISGCIAATDGMGTAMVARLRAILGIHSPSKVFEKLGGYVGEGFSMGVANDTGPASAVADLIASPAELGQDARQVASSMRGGAPPGSTTYQITVVAPSGRAEDIRDTLADLLDELEASAA